MLQPIDSSSFYFGTSDTDSLKAGPGEFVLLGLDGDDTLTSRWNAWDWSIGTLLGGRGNDTYYADGDVTVIFDIGGQDTVYVPGYRDDFEGAFLNGRDLVLVNLWTEQAVMVLDFHGVGRIETFVDARGERLSASQVESMVRTDGLGDVSYTELQSFTGDYSLSAAQFEDLREIDMAFGRLNWDNVFDHIAKHPTLTQAVIADAIQFEALGILSARAREAWHESGYYEALLTSVYHGLEDNVPDRGPTGPVLPRQLVEDMALLYQAALDRRPDEVGLNYFVGDLKAGQSLQDIAHSFYISDEFRRQFDSFDDRQYIDQLYLNVLGREADSTGMTYWLEDIQERDRSHADVLVSFAQSDENRDNAADWLVQLSHDAGADFWFF